MNQIISELEKLGIPKEQLPKSIINKIDHLEALKEQLGLAREEYSTEEDTEIRQEMRETIVAGEEEVTDFEQVLDEAVKEFLNNLRQNQNVDAQDTSIAPISTNLRPNSIGQEKKGSNGWKWIFGGVILLVTLGAVNTLNKE